MKILFPPTFARKFSASISLPFFVIAIKLFLWLIRPVYSRIWKVWASCRQKQLSTKVLIQTKRLPFFQDMQIGLYYRNNTHAHTSKCSYGSVKSLHAIGNVDWIGCSSKNQILQWDRIRWMILCNFELFKLIELLCHCNILCIEFIKIHFASCFIITIELEELKLARISINTKIKLKLTFWCLTY